MIMIYFSLFIIMILVLIPLLVFRGTSQELNSDLPLNDVKNIPLVYQSQVKEYTLLDAFFRVVLVLVCYIISSFGIFGTRILIDILIESHFGLFAYFISLGWVSHFFLCCAWILNSKKFRFISFFYIFVSISCAIVP